MLTTYPGHHSDMNVHQNLNPYFPLLLLPTMETGGLFSPCQVQTALFHNCTTGTFYGEQGTINLLVRDDLF